MVFSDRKKSTLERRLRDLQKEADLVRSDIKTLSKAVKNPDEIGGVRLKSAPIPRSSVPPPMRRDPATAASAAESPPAKGSPDLFNWGSGTAPSGTLKPSPGLPAFQASATGGEPKNTAVMKNERFANYFSSGNFLGVRARQQGKNVPRNKAIFMIVIVIVVAFSVFRMLLR